MLYPFNGYLDTSGTSRVPCHKAADLGPWGRTLHPGLGAIFRKGRRGCFWLMVMMRFNEIHIISHYFHILEIIWFLFLILRWKSQGAMNSYDLCLKCSLCFCNFKGECVRDGASPFVIGIQNGADHDGICSTSGPSTMTNSSLYIIWI